MKDLKGTKTTVKIYKDSKHEMYTETKDKRDEAFSDLVGWLNSLI